MTESQDDIDALLAEVNALADEAVSEIVGDDSPSPEAHQPASPPSPAASISPPPVSSSASPATASPRPSSVSDLTRGSIPRTELCIPPPQVAQ